MDGLPRGYDAWRTSGPLEPIVVGRCATCQGDIVEGDTVVVTVDGDRLHADCLEATYVLRRYEVDGEG